MLVRMQTVTIQFYSLLFRSVPFHSIPVSTVVCSFSFSFSTKGVLRCEAMQLCPRNKTRAERYIPCLSVSFQTSHGKRGYFRRFGRPEGLRVSGGLDSTRLDVRVSWGVYSCTVPRGSTLLEYLGNALLWRRTIRRDRQRRYA